MTSIHMNSSEAQTTAPSLNGSLNQGQAAPSKYDEAERVRQRMEELRRHHAESADIHNRTQPIIDEQIHEDTIKYLKSNQVNGTKTKSQKPRAPKRQRTTANATTTSNNTNNNVSASSTPGVRPGSANNGHGQVVTSRPSGTPNHLQHPVPRPQQIPPIAQQQHMQQQVTPQPQVIMQAGVQQMHQISAPYPPTHMQQLPMHMQHQQRPNQSQVSHQAYNGAYHSNQYESPPMSYPQQQPQHHQQQQQQQPSMQTVPHNQHMQASIDQGVHYDNHQGYAQQNHHGYYQTQPVVSNHQQNHVNMGHQNHVQHNSYSTLPNDLDLNLQAGLECDIDSLIKHEMSVEGQLDFNNDLLLKLDNHYQLNHHHRQHHQ